jgi:hypothetical protein
MCGGLLPRRCSFRLVARFDGIVARSFHRAALEEVVRQGLIVLLDVGRVRALHGESNFSVQLPLLCGSQPFIEGFLDQLVREAILLFSDDMLANDNSGGFGAVSTIRKSSEGLKPSAHLHMTLTISPPG